MNQTHANEVHARTRHSKYTPKRALAKLDLINFVTNPKPTVIIWNRSPRPIINTITLYGVDWHEISIGAGMTHKFKAA